MFRKTKSKLAVLLSLALCVSMMASTNVFAADEAEKQLILHDAVAGETREVTIKDGYSSKTFTHPSEGLGFDGLEPFEIQDIDALNGVDDGIDSYGFTQPWPAVSNPSAFPYRAIAQLVIRFPTHGTKIGTGFVADDGVVLTAGHCIFDYDDETGEGEWASSIDLYFGRNGNTAYKQVTSRKFSVSPGWHASADASIADDYGSIIIDEAVTALTGKFGLYVGLYDSQVYTLTGFCNDYPYNDKKMHTDSGTVTAIYDGWTQYPHNATNGTSGSPLYGSNNYAVAIHTKGIDDTNPQGGIGTNITSSVLDLVAYKW